MCHEVMKPRCKYSEEDHRHSDAYQQGVEGTRHTCPSVMESMFKATQNSYVETPIPM